MNDTFQESTQLDDSEDRYSYETIDSTANFLLERTKHRPTVGVICGSGMSGLADMMEDKQSFLYSDIPNFPISTVSGHAGKLMFGVLNGETVVCMQGRFHAYEGYPLWKCVMPVQVMKLLGVRTLIVTNAAGGVNPEFQVGDIMLMKDHINFLGFGGDNPLKGKNDERWGSRFLAMNDCYEPKLRRLAREIGEELGFGDIVREGVYAIVGGPTYETVAEVRLLRILGVDVVGMSTAHEVIAARHCGLRVLGLTMITNKCVTDYEVKEMASHEEVLEICRSRNGCLQNLIGSVVGKLNALS